MVTDANTKLAYSRAQDKAKEMGGASRVTDLGGGKYSVLSSAGDQTYTVTVIERPVQELFICSCPAGSFGKLCKHKVWVFKVRTMARTREAMRHASRPSDPTLCTDCGATPATFIPAGTYPNGPGRCGDCHNAEMKRREVCTHEGCTERPTHTERIMGEGRWVCETHRSRPEPPARSTSARAAIWPEAY